MPDLETLVKNISNMDTCNIKASLEALANSGKATALPCFLPKLLNKLEQDQAFILSVLLSNLEHLDFSSFKPEYKEYVCLRYLEAINFLSFKDTKKAITLFQALEAKNMLNLSQQTVRMANHTKQTIKRQNALHHKPAQNVDSFLNEVSNNMQQKIVITNIDANINHAPVGAKRTPQTPNVATPDVKDNIQAVAERFNSIEDVINAPIEALTPKVATQPTPTQAQMQAPAPAPTPTQAPAPTQAQAINNTPTPEVKEQPAINTTPAPTAVAPTPLETPAPTQAETISETPVAKTSLASSIKGNINNLKGNIDSLKDNFKGNIKDNLKNNLDALGDNIKDNINNVLKINVEEVDKHFEQIKQFTTNAIKRTNPTPNGESTITKSAEKLKNWTGKLKSFKKPSE